MKNLLSLSMIALILVLMVGCSEANSPAGPPPLSAEFSYLIMDSDPPLEPLQWPLPLPSDMPMIALDIAGNVGATIPFSSTVPNTDGSLIQVSGLFVVPPAALAKDTKITLSLDAKALAIRFEPEGLVFAHRTMLKWTISGLGPLPKDPPIRFCFVDENGIPTEMPNSGVTVDYDRGFIQVKDGAVPHFSRSAFVRW